MGSIGESQRRKARANRPLGRRIDFFNGLLAEERKSKSLPELADDALQRQLETMIHLKDETWVELPGARPSQSPEASSSVASSHAAHRRVVTSSRHPPTLGNRLETCSRASEAQRSGFSPPMFCNDRVDSGTRVVFFTIEVVVGRIPPAVDRSGRRWRLGTEE